MPPLAPRGNGARAEGQPGSASSKRKGDHMTASIDQSFLGHRPVTQCLCSHSRTHFPFPFSFTLVGFFSFFSLFLPFLSSLSSSLPRARFHTLKLPPIHPITPPQLRAPSHRCVNSTLNPLFGFSLVSSFLTIFFLVRFLCQRFLSLCAFLSFLLPFCIFAYCP